MPTSTATALHPSFWRTSFEEHGGVVLAFLTSRVGRRDLAEDLLQETFVRAIRAEALEDLSKVRSYLLSIAHRLVLDPVRKQRPVLFSEISTDEPIEDVRDHAAPSPDDRAESGFVEQRLSTTVEALNEPLRAAFEAAVIEQRSYADIAAAPADLKPHAWRLAGVLKTESREFRGFIQWDLEECLSTDELDGETRDGDMSIEMGRIAAIEKNNRNGAWVELRDGRRLLLEDTNDVDHSTSGIFVEDERFGRVKVAWDEFERVDFEVSGRSGRGYDEYQALGALKGRVIDLDGAASSGTLVIDLDESRGWEILNGSLDDIEYNLPFAMIRSLEPTSRDRTIVGLRSGEELELEDGTDVSDDNDGVLVVTGDAENYIAWRDIERIELE
ncbi:MAG: RNA polymerase sigma factor [Acidobacteriota bacterium]|nr:RNA polymerase sigma factor [Acidobacteriota bacterium]